MRVLNINPIKNRIILKNHKTITVEKDKIEKLKFKSRLIHPLELKLLKVENIKSRKMIMKSKKKFTKIFKIVETDLVIWTAVTTVIKKIQVLVHMQQEEAQDCIIEK